MYTSSFYIKTILGLEGKSLKEISRLLLAYDEKRGYGFLDTNIFDNGIGSTLVYKSIITQSLFEPSTKQFNNVQQTIYEQTSFEIFPSQNLIHIYDSERKTKNTIQYLSNSFRQKIGFEDVFADIPLILKKMTKLKIRYSILSFSINNFRPQIGIIGKFTPSVSDTKVAQKIINAYHGDITNIQLELRNTDTNYWYLTSNGKIAVKSSTSEMLQENIQVIKTLISGK